MNHLKATDIVALRKIVRARGAEMEKVLLDSLSPEAKAGYENALATSWVSQAVEKEIMEACTRQLFPKEIAGLRQLGKLLAQHNLTGIYKVFLRIPTIEFVIKRVADLWKMFFQKGSAKAEIVAPRQGVLAVYDYPELMPYQREVIAGYIHGVLELAGARQVQVSLLPSDAASAWKWEVTWE